MKKRFIPLLLLPVLLLQACGSTPNKQTTAEIVAQTKTTPSTPEELLAKAKISQNPEQQNRLTLEAAQLFCDAQLISQCHAALNEININTLQTPLKAQYLALALSLNIAGAPSHTLLNTYESMGPSISEKLSIEQQLLLFTQLSQAHAENKSYINSALMLFDNIGLFPAESQQDTNEKAWKLLRLENAINLTRFTYTGNNEATFAWIELAKAIQVNQISLEEQYKAYQSWKALWPNHPAATTPTKELSILSELPDSKPKMVVLALPLSGPLSEAGIAIRDGFMAAHYAHQQFITQPDNTPQVITREKATASNNSSLNQSFDIQFFDTHRHDIAHLYEQQLDQAMIVGPVDKPSLEKLSTLDHITTPTLALNKLKSATASEQLYQFSLAPESEATQIAKHLAEENIHKAALILPESNLGFRMLDSLQQAFTESSSYITDSAFYTDQTSLAGTVSQLLNTQKSKERKNRIQAITGERFEFYPRRRMDLDAIIMVARPSTAKQLKPLLAYNYASDLPVYASSLIHSPNEPDKNRDLEGIKFPELPWMLSNTISAKNDIANEKPNASQNYGRFHALGADAYALLPRLRLLREVQDSQFQGQTGTLKVNASGIIERKMEWATFRRGEAIALRR